MRMDAGALCHELVDERLPTVGQRPAAPLGEELAEIRVCLRASLLAHVLPPSCSTTTVVWRPSVRPDIISRTGTRTPSS